MRHTTVPRCTAPPHLACALLQARLPRATDNYFTALPQVVSLVLVIFAVTYPLLACSKASGFEGVYTHWLAPTLSFVVVLSYFGLYEVSPIHTHTRHAHAHAHAHAHGRQGRWRRVSARESLSVAAAVSQS